MLQHFIFTVMILTHHVLFKHAVLGEPNRYAIIPGDVLIGAIFPVHASASNPDSTQHSSHCGHIQEQDGIQPLEALMYTVDKINSDSSFLPGFSLGAVSLDSCDNTAYALEQSVEFVKLLVARISGDDGLSYTCPNGTKPKLVPGSVDFHKMVGVVGGASSTVSIYVANLLQLFKVPQISYLSTSPDLSNKERFPYFQRTVPSDLNQAQAIVELLKQNQWTYISAVYVDSNYGLKGFSELEKRAEKAEICFALRLKVPVDPNVGNYKDVVEALFEKQEARVVVLYLDTPQARALFAAVNSTLNGKRQRRNKLIWIGSDAWSARQSVVEELEHVAEDAITVQPLAEVLPGFDDYFTSLNPIDNKRNPWFPEFWAEHFKCDYGGHSGGEVVNEFSRRECTGREKISLSTGYRQQMYFHFVKDAVYAFAHALKNMHSAYCGANFTGLCEAMEPEKLNGTALLHFIKTVNFTDKASGREFAFVNGVDGPPRYTYVHFKKFKGSEYRWHLVGNYSGVYEIPQLDLSPVFLQDLRLYPASSCKEKCSPGQAQVHLKDNSCCWVCTNCTENQFLPQPDKCDTCALGTWPNSHYNACEPLPLTYMSHVNGLGIGSCVFAVIGMVVCIVIGAVFHVYRDTPVIKASGRELSYVLLAGIFLSYSSPLIFVAKPSAATCALTRILLGVCYTVCYAAILTKTNRISRIFLHDSSSTTKTKFTDPKSSLMIVFCFTSVELVILAVWLIAIRPDIAHSYPTSRDNILICAGANGVGYLIALAYPFLLIILCTVYAVKTRKTPDGFNEARYIAFTNYTTCVLWLAFVPMYIATPTHDIRVFTMCMAVALSGTVQLACLFMPKLYIVLLHPEKNTREAVMTKKRSMSNTSGWSNSHMIYGENNVHLTIPATDNRSSGIMSMDSAFNLSHATDSIGLGSTPHCASSTQKTQITVETSAATNGDVLKEKRARTHSLTTEQNEQDIKRNSGSCDGLNQLQNDAGVFGDNNIFPTSRSDPNLLSVTSFGDSIIRPFVTSTPRTGSRDVHVDSTKEDLSSWRSLRQIHSAPNSRPRSPVTLRYSKSERLSGSHQHIHSRDEVGIRTHPVISASVVSNFPLDISSDGNKSHSFAQEATTCTQKAQKRLDFEDADTGAKRNKIGSKSYDRCTQDGNGCI